MMADDELGLAGSSATHGATHLTNFSQYFRDSERQLDMFLGPTRR